METRMRSGPALVLGLGVAALAIAGARLRR
jgi:hypothetical protein